MSNQENLERNRRLREMAIVLSELQTRAEKLEELLIQEVEIFHTELMGSPCKLDKTTWRATLNWQAKSLEMLVQAENERLRLEKLRPC